MADTDRLEQDLKAQLENSRRKLEKKDQKIEELQLVAEKAHTVFPEIFI